MALSRREWLVLGGVGAAAAIAGAVVGPILRQSGSGAADLLATPLPGLDGQPRRLSDWHGKVVLCNFWATWCAPCREEIPMLVDLRERYLAQGFEVVGIAVDKADKVGEFAAKYQVSYPILVAESVGLDLMRKLGNGAGGLPFTVLLDRQGSVLNRKLGILRRKDIEPEIKALLSA
ncbi:MAG TPA: TlpA disulfide reductase family protein [Burkholderiales bacterium]|nr:TlpA disulfide reductase family protein [Burkholderiales bacterium]